MAKKRKSSRPQKTTKSGGGTMTGMRSGFQSIVGTKKGGQKKTKKKADFWTVLFFLFAIGVVLVIIWQMRG